MKASRTTNGPITGNGALAGERTLVALALRDKNLSATLAVHLVAEGDAAPLVCPFTDPERLKSWLDEHRADVLLLDERWLHRLNGSLARLRSRWPEQRVLLVGDRACTALAELVVRNRLHGFLLANGAVQTCVKAVRTVKQGETWVPRALLLELLFEHFGAADFEPPEADGKLTPRELQVVGYVRRGLANKQIAESLAIREDTVKKHLRNAYTKLGVHRRSEIMMSGAERLLSG